MFELIFVTVTIIVTFFTFFFLMPLVLGVNNYNKKCEKKKYEIKSLIASKSKKDIRKWQEFIKTFEKMSNLTERKLQFPWIQNLSLNEDGLIRFSINKKMEEEQTLEEFKKIKDYPSIKMLTVKSDRKNTTKGQRIGIHLITGGLWQLSKDDFDDYCGTKFNPLLEQRMERLIELISKEELFANIWPLINKYEITFNTILNVINEYNELKNEQQLSKEIENNILQIIETFEQDVMKVNKENEILNNEIKKGLEKSLNERLEIEVELLSKTPSS